jgi:hypothetical protein
MMADVKRVRSDGRGEVASIDRKIESGVKKRQAMSETLEPSLTVKTGDATKRAIRK